MPNLPTEQMKERNRTIRARYEAGATVKALAHDFTLSTSAIRIAIIKAGGEMKPKTKTGMPTPEEVVTLYNGGMGQNQIARHFGCSPSAIAGRLKKMGIVVGDSEKLRSKLAKVRADLPAIKEANRQARERVAREIAERRFSHLADRKLFVCPPPPPQLPGWVPPSQRSA